MVAVGRAGPARVDLLERLAGDLCALLLVLTPIALLNVLVGTRPSGPPGPVESDVVVSAGLGAAGEPLDLGFRWQLGVAQAVAGAGVDASLLQSARGLCLLAGLTAAALLWPLLRRMDLGSNAATTAVIVAGLGPLALRLQPGVDPGALAAGWIALAAAAHLLRPGAVRRALVAALLLMAVVTAPVAAAGLLAGAGYALLTARTGAGLRPGLRVALALLAALGAIAVAVLVLRLRVADVVSAVPLSTVFVVLGLGALIIVRMWDRRQQLRPPAVMAAVWLCCAIGSGPARLTALLLAVPALALLVGTLLADAAAEQWPRFSMSAATAVTVALVSGVVTGLWPQPPPGTGSYAPLARWLTGELEESVVLSAAPLDRAELVAAGVPAERFAVNSVPAGAVTVVPSAAGCGDVGAPVAQLASVGGALSVCAPPAAPSDMVLTAGTGPLLARSSTLRMAEPARQLLVEDRVDSRLATVLAGAAMTHDVEVNGFPVVPGEPAEAARRVAVLGGVIPVLDVNGRPAASSLELYLNAQPPPFRPDVRSLPDGRLVVHFRLPTGGGSTPG